MDRVKYNNTYIYVDSSPIDETEMGLLELDNDELDNTMPIDIFSNEELLASTVTDLLGGNDE